MGHKSRRQDYPGVHWQTCPDDGKRGYLSRKDAKEVIKGMPVDGHLSVYACGELFHIGNLPGNVVEGLTSRADLAPTRPK